MLSWVGRASPLSGRASVPFLLPARVLDRRRRPVWRNTVFFKHLLLLAAGSLPLNAGDVVSVVLLPGVPGVHRGRAVRFTPNDFPPSVARRWLPLPFSRQGVCSVASQSGIVCVPISGSTGSSRRGIGSPSKRASLHSGPPLPLPHRAWTWSRTRPSTKRSFPCTPRWQGK